MVRTLVGSRRPQQPTLSSKYLQSAISLYAGLAEQLHISVLFSPLDMCAPLCHELNLMYPQSQACSINPRAGSGIGLSRKDRAAEASPAPPTQLTFEQYILREAPLWSRVWPGVQLGQEAGAVMPGGVVGEVSGDEAVGKG